MPRAPLILVISVFLASLATLVASTALALFGSSDELEAQDRLWEAAVRIAEAANSTVSGLPADEPGTVLPEADNRRLAAIVSAILAACPAAEGGFYFARSDQFAGVVTPAPAPAPEPDLEKGKKGKGADKKGEKNHERKDSAKELVAAGRRDPPPLETNPIRQQARLCLSQEAGSPPLVQIRDIGPSRVGVATTPVGDDRPSRAAVWVMIRLTGPQQQKDRLQRLQWTTGLSLFGLLLALGLTIGLVRYLREETRQSEKLRDELRKAEYLAALGRLLAGVAHEVRNPLTAIRSTVQLWERLPEHARTPESLAAVVAGVDRLNDLVGRLLLFARAGHEERRQVDLNAVVAETLELVRARAEAQKVLIEANLAPRLPFALGATQSLGQVALNLVANALQAMPNGGVLTCRTQSLDGNRVQLTVTDTGPGVPEHLRERIFEPFFTTRAEGTGLGLALCREVARQHGGDVTLDPSARAGAVFVLTLPIDRGETQ